jgi:hypothetical protein
MSLVVADGGGEGGVVVGMRRIEPLMDIEVAFAGDVDTFDSIELPVKGTRVGLPELKADVLVEKRVGHRDVASTGKGCPVLFQDVVKTEEGQTCLASATVLTHGDPLSNRASASWYTSGCKGTLGLREGKIAFWQASLCRQQALRRRTTGSAGGGGGWLDVALLQYVVEGLDVVGGPQDFTKVALHPARGLRVTVVAPALPKVVAAPVDF